MQKKTILFTIVALITAIQVIILPVAVLAEDVVSTDAAANTPVSDSISAPVISDNSMTTDVPTTVNETAPENIVVPEQSDSVINDEPAAEVLSDTIDQNLLEIDQKEIQAPAENLAMPEAVIAEPEPIVEAVAPAPYELPTNPLCKGITGDLNGDGMINKYDTEVMLQMAKGLEPFNPCGDLDLDGFVGPGDISILTKIYKSDLPAHPEIVAELAELRAEAEAERTADPSLNSCTLGDANGDNMIDYKDKGLILQMMKGEFPRTVAADLDGDGFVGPGDLSLVTSMIKSSHAASAAVTEEEKGNCNVPTASILYSIDGGETYVTNITVKNGDTLTIKVVYSKPLNQFEVTFLDIDNGLPTDIYMPKLDDSTATYNLVINNPGNLTVTVSVRTINGAFPDNVIVLTGGSTFTIKNPVVSGGSYGGGIAPVCTEVIYSDWSDCVDGKQTRNMVTKTPEACEWTEAQFAAQEQTCEVENLEAQIVSDENEENTEEVLGVKVYPDGTLLRAINDIKIFIIENGFKRHVRSLQELAAKYRGQTIYNVAPEILAAYPTVE